MTYMSRGICHQYLPHTHTHLTFTAHFLSSLNLHIYIYAIVSSLSLLLNHLVEPTTASPTVYNPKECSSYHSNYKDWAIESATGSFLDETDNLYWIITADTLNEENRWLFSETTEYKFDPSYSNMLFIFCILNGLISGENISKIFW